MPPPSPCPSSFAPFPIPPARPPRAAGPCSSAGLAPPRRWVGPRLRARVPVLPPFRACSCLPLPFFRPPSRAPSAGLRPVCALPPPCGAPPWFFGSPVLVLSPLPGAFRFALPLPLPPSARARLLLAFPPSPLASALPPPCPSPCPFSPSGLALCRGFPFALPPSRSPCRSLFCSPCGAPAPLARAPCPARCCVPSWRPLFSLSAFLARCLLLLPGPSPRRPLPLGVRAPPPRRFPFGPSPGPSLSRSPLPSSSRLPPPLARPGGPSGRGPAPSLWPLACPPGAPWAPVLFPLVPAVRLSFPAAFGAPPVPSPPFRGPLPPSSPSGPPSPPLALAFPSCPPAFRLRLLPLPPRRVPLCPPVARLRLAAGGPPAAAPPLPPLGSGPSPVSRSLALGASALAAAAGCSLPPCRSPLSPSSPSLPPAAPSFSLPLPPASCVFPRPPLTAGSPPPWSSSSASSSWRGPPSSPVLPSSPSLPSPRPSPLAGPPCSTPSVPRPSAGRSLPLLPRFFCPRVLRLLPLPSPSALPPLRPPPRAFSALLRRLPSSLLFPLPPASFPAPSPPSPSFSLASAALPVPPRPPAPPSLWSLSPPLPAPPSPGRPLPPPLPPPSPPSHCPAPPYPPPWSLPAPGRRSLRPSPPVCPCPCSPLSSWWPPSSSSPCFPARGALLSPPPSPAFLPLPGLSAWPRGPPARGFRRVPPVPPSPVAVWASPSGGLLLPSRRPPRRGFLPSALLSLRRALPPLMPPLLRSLPPRCRLASGRLPLRCPLLPCVRPRGFFVVVWRFAPRSGAPSRSSPSPPGGLSPRRRLPLVLPCSSAASPLPAGGLSVCPSSWPSLPAFLSPPSPLPSSVSFPFLRLGRLPCVLVPPLCRVPSRLLPCRASRFFCRFLVSALFAASLPPLPLLSCLFPLGLPFAAPPPPLALFSRIPLRRPRCRPWARPASPPPPFSASPRDPSDARVPPPPSLPPSASLPRSLRRPSCSRSSLLPGRCPCLLPVGVVLPAARPSPSLSSFPCAGSLHFGLAGRWAGACAFPLPAPGAPGGVGRRLGRAWRRSASARLPPRRSPCLTSRLGPCVLSLAVFPLAPWRPGSFGPLPAATSLLSPSWPPSPHRPPRRPFSLCPPPPSPLLLPFTPALARPCPSSPAFPRPPRAFIHTCSPR
ncbi:UNVERIFIED_CONTAM: hypothetical protein Sangu_3116100 [Sesamum angustifolium]|uniref:Uncharacterized protein n=1 Tax=Sesamum angustifolium TaxID=2727405 RepID=A0AAW2K6A5_9LAMI